MKYNDFQHKYHCNNNTNNEYCCNQYALYLADLFRLISTLTEKVDSQKGEIDRLQTKVNSQDGEIVRQGREIVQLKV